MNGRFAELIYVGILIGVLVILAAGIASVD